MYWRDKWEFVNSIEHEIKFMGKYGAAGEKRAGRKKPTPEQVKKQNQYNREKRMRRLIKKNFRPGDLWCTLKYAKGQRLTMEQLRKDVDAFLRSVRGKYKRRGAALKFVLRKEIGERGGIHVHILVNRLPGWDTDLLLQGSWKHGRINFQSISEYGGYRKLAEYIVKQPDEEAWAQLALFPEEERRELIRYSCSRNLERPEPEREFYSRRTVRKLLEEGPVPTPGFYIDKASVVSGVNRFTGMSYLHYTECRIAELVEKEAEDAADRYLHRHKPKGS